MNKGISIAVVTKNRPVKLRRCLESILKQTKLPDMVIIVDNDVKKSAKKLAFSFKKELNLVYTVETRPGVAQARNKALKTCKTSLLGFVDDDCVLNRNWVKVGMTTMNMRKKATFVLGKSSPLNANNIVALAQYYHQSYWFNQKLRKSKKGTSPFNLDTKNVIFRISNLRKNRLKFDTKFSIKGSDSSDTDLGFQLEEKGLFGVYKSRMIVFHEELENPIKYLKKAYLKGRLAFLLSLKWNLKGEFVDLKLVKWIKFVKSARFWKKEFFFYTRKRKESFFLKISSFILIKICERFYLKGYVSQAGELGVDLYE